MKKCVCLAVVVLCMGSLVWAEDDLAVLNDQVLPQPELMLSNWLAKQSSRRLENWRTQYDSLKSSEQIEEYQKRLRQSFVEAVGGFPERTPLNSQVVGIVERDGYRVEKVIFESQPQHYVTGLCFVPDSPKYQAPYPGVLLVCGHSANGKGYPGYQTAAALTALNGMVGFIIDPVCQGERYQALKDDGDVLVPQTTLGHTFAGLGAILVGKNTAGNLIWDGMRAIDYLQERGDVDPDKIGCMGNSGGGTQTAYLMALEDRIQAASPSCYLTTYKHLLEGIGPQDAEQIIFGQLDWGMDHADYVIMRAPIPIMMCTATHDFFPIEGAWQTFRDGKRIYTRLGYPDRINLAEVDEKHGWSLKLREAAVSWMKRWLLGVDEAVREPSIKLLSEPELQVSPQGQVMRIAGAKSLYDLNLEEFQRFQPQREANWKDPARAVESVREIAKIRPLAELPPPEAIKTGETKVDGVTVEKWALKSADGIVLPTLLYRPEKVTGEPGLFVHEQGKLGVSDEASGAKSALGLAREGHLVLAVDLRGTGETTPQKAYWYNKVFGDYGRLVATAYLIGENFVGMRAEDLLVSARWFLNHEQLPLDQKQLAIVSVGNVGVPALHAAVLENQLFGDVTLIGSLESWETILSSPTSEDQFVNCIHGALREYDLSDLIATLGDRVHVISPVDALGNPVK